MPGVSSKLLYLHYGRRGREVTSPHKADQCDRSKYFSMFEPFLCREGVHKGMVEGADPMALGAPSHRIRSSRMRPIVKPCNEFVEASH